MGGIASRPAPPPPPPAPVPAPSPQPAQVVAEQQESTDDQRRRASTRRTRRSGRALISGSPLGITGDASTTGSPIAPTSSTLGPS